MKLSLLLGTHPLCCITREFAIRSAPTREIAIHLPLVFLRSSTSSLSGTSAPSPLPLSVAASLPPTSRFFLPNAAAAPEEAAATPSDAGGDPDTFGEQDFGKQEEWVGFQVCKAACTTMGLKSLPVANLSLCQVVRSVFSVVAAKRLIGIVCRRLFRPSSSSNQLRPSGQTAVPVRGMAIGYSASSVQIDDGKKGTALLTRTMLCSSLAVVALRLICAVVIFRSLTTSTPTTWPV